MTLLLGATLIPTNDLGKKEPPGSSVDEVTPGEAAYRGGSGSVTPYDGPVVTPGKIADVVGAAMAAVKGKPLPVRRTPFARIVRFARE